MFLQYMVPVVGTLTRFLLRVLRGIRFLCVCAPLFFFVFSNPPMKQTKIIVLDINGVVADVRRREAVAVRGRAPDAVLPNGHKVYLHPRVDRFLKWLSALEHVSVVTYTSRLQRNAEPIESLIGETHIKPIARLYGEDCMPAGTDRNDPFHPIKTIDAVLSRVASQPSDILFVDDHPSRIKTGGAAVVQVRTYDAANSGTECFIYDVVRDIQSQLVCWSSPKKIVP